VPGLPVAPKRGAERLPEAIGIDAMAKIITINREAQDSEIIPA
jgi:hypothetical protein